MSRNPRKSKVDALVEACGTDDEWKGQLLSGAELLTLARWHLDAGLLAAAKAAPQNAEEWTQHIESAMQYCAAAIFVFEENK
jgi:hypothetical protein